MNQNAVTLDAYLNLVSPISTHLSPIAMFTTPEIINLPRREKDTSFEYWVSEEVLNTLFCIAIEELDWLHSLKSRELHDPALPRRDIWECLHVCLKSLCIE
jgi:hypothetical protein